VPLSLLLPKDYPMDGSRPLLLYAYGSYGATMEPTFDSEVLSLVDRGFGYGIAHIRSGQEAEHLQRLHRRRRLRGP